MPLTVFDIKGVPSTRRERIEQAVVAAGKHLREPYEAWISTDPFRGGVRVMITGPHGFQRQVAFAANAQAAAAGTVRVEQITEAMSPTATTLIACPSFIRLALPSVRRSRDGFTYAIGRNVGIGKAYRPMGCRRDQQRRCTQTPRSTLIVDVRTRNLILLTG
jgi:hypothetical protein